jgi:hypothetical protein
MQYNCHNSGHYHCPVSYLKHDVPETEFCLRLQVEPTQVGPTEETSLSSDTSNKTNAVYKHKPRMRVNISTPWVSTNVGPVLYAYALIHG